ncbi:elongation factor G [Chloroflexota bacterium]
MEQYGLENIRNLVLLSHSGAGKTSLSEAMLFDTKAVTRLGKVDDGTTTSDYDPDEVKRKISINLSIIPCLWQGNKINILDAPGYPDFVGEVKAAMRVSEGALIVICAASGVEVGAEQVWGYCEESDLPRLIFINKMDRENADFGRTMGEVREKFGTSCIPVHLPIGAQNDFQGLIDLLTMKSYLGTEMKEGEIPSQLQDEANSLRDKLVEAVAETDDVLIEKYLEGEELTQDEIGGALRNAVAAGKIIPVLAGSALRNIGLASLLEAVASYIPAPKDRDVVLAGESGKDGEQRVKPSQDGPLAALVFKTTADPYVGKLTYFRVYTGAFDSNSQVWNAQHGAMERIGQLFVVKGKNQEPVPQLMAGDIGAVAKLNVTGTGDTLCSKENPAKLASIAFAKPIYSLAVHPKTKADVDKLGTALTRISEEDLTIEVRRETGTHETVLWGMGETHIDVVAEKMFRKFGVGVTLETPKVPYQETITTSAKGEYKHKKQTGGHGQYGHVLLSLEPLSRGSGMEFANKVVGGTIPKNYIPAVEKGVNEGIQEGALGGYPVVDIKTTVYDGSFHPVDSSEICFKIAGAQAFKKGMIEGQPILLEPIMNLKVTVPDDYTGDIIGDLNTKRARVVGMNPEHGINIIEAQAPLAEVQRYAIDLRSMTQARGTFTMEFSHYEEMPAQVAQKVIAAKQTEKA